MSNPIQRAVVAKYELYPASGNPTGYAVGFNVNVVGGESFYIDTVIPLENGQGLSNTEVSDLAWESVRNAALAKADKLVNYSDIIGHIVEQNDPQAVYPWIQPAGAGDEYSKGDQVSHDGYIWASKIDGNIWEPGVYGWSIVGTEQATPGDEQATPVDDEQATPGTDEPPAWQAWDGNNENLHQVDDRVTHNGQVWIATVGNNHWEPGIYGWEVE